MKIKIETIPDQALLLTEASRSAIHAALDGNNGKAVAFTINRAHDLTHVVEKADECLRATGVTEAETFGTIITYRPRGLIANAHRKDNPVDYIEATESAGSYAKAK